MYTVGLTPSVRDNGWITVNKDYIDAVTRAGMLPVLLPLTDDRAMLDAALAAVDALVFTGGGDVNPARYGEEGLPELDGVSDKRDDMEIYLARRALAQNIPTLAICRGIQVLAVAFGGSLYQDIGRQYKKDIEHSRMDLARDVVHAVAVAEDSMLYAVTGMNRIMVNTRHHQAIKAMPEGFAVTAVAPDGVIEAMERRGGSFCLATQWHPEALSDRYPEHHKLFEALRRACEERNR